MKLYFIPLLLVLSACGAAKQPAPTAQTVRDEVPFSAELAQAYLSARLAATTGDISQAATSYLGAVAADPTRPEQLVQAFHFQLADGNFTTAADLAERIVAEIPDPSPLTYLTLATQAIKLNKPGTALRYVSTAQEAAPDLLQFELAQTYLKIATGEPLPKIIADLKTYEAHPALVAHQLYHVGRLHELAGEPRQAELAYLDALKKDQRSIFPTLQLAQLKLQQGDVDGALALYEDYVANNPQTIFINDAASLLEHTQNQPEQPKNLQRQWAEVMFGFATLMNHQGLPVASQQMLTLASEVAPDLPFLGFYKGVIFERSGNPTAALAAYAAVPTHDPTWLAANIRRADVLAKQGDVAAAKDHLLTLMQTAGELDLVFQAMGDLAYQEENYQRAVHYYDQVLNQRDNYTERHASVFFARGVAYERMDDVSNAESDLQSALVLEPNNASILNYLGYLWVDSGRNLDQAFSLLAKALILRPQDGAIHDSIGWAYFKKGRMEKALKHIEYAVELAPEDPVVNAHLGDVYASLGRLREAKRQWERALELGLEEKRDLERVEAHLMRLNPAQAD